MVEFSEDPQCSLEQDGVFRLRNIVHTTGIERTAIERVSTHLLEEDWRKSWSSSSKKRRRRRREGRKMKTRRKRRTSSRKGKRRSWMRKLGEEVKIIE